MKRLLGLATLVLALSGCAFQPTNAVEKASAPPPATPVPSFQVAAFGDTVKFPGGVALTAKASVQPAGPYAAGAVEGRIVIVEVTVTNNSTTPFNAALVAYPKVTYGAKGFPAENAVDGDKTSGSIGNLLPGEAQTATSGYGIPSAGLADVRIEFSGPSHGDDPAIFKGAVK